jgi:hypothetical protein
MRRLCVVKKPQMADSGAEAIKASIPAMWWLKQLTRQVRHPALALVGAVLFACAAVALMRYAIDMAERLAAADDPVQITDWALDRAFNPDVADREIRSALAAGDVDLAQSFVALAADRDVSVDPALVESVKDASVKQASVADTAGRFARGFWTGEPADLASLAGTAAGDLFVFGDIRDAAREGMRYLTGQKFDPWILGLASAGIAITAGTYATLGAGVPERVGLSLVKAARRAGRLNPALVARTAREAVKVEEAGGLVELAGNVRNVETKAGAQAALDSLAIAEGPEDVSRLARLAAAKGGKTRAIMKLLGRAAIMLTASALDLAIWLFWATFAVLGFFSSCKAAVERVTQRRLDKRKVRRARAAELQYMAGSARA